MIWQVMIICGIITFASRFVMFSDIAPKRLPQWMSEALGFLPICVLTAILVPPILLDAGGQLDIHGNPRLLAALVAMVMLQATHSVLLTIVTGLSALWLLEQIVI